MAYRCTSRNSCWRVFRARRGHHYDQQYQQVIVDVDQAYWQIVSIANKKKLADKELSERIRYKYSIKNVTGLNIFPFIRFEDPFDIIAHLLVGSEGTLAFMSQVTMKTLPLPAKEASAMVYFGTIREAAEAVVALRKDIDPAALDAAELLDKRSLASVDDPMLKDYPGKDLTALLLRVTGAGQEDLDANVNRLTDVLRGFSTLKGADGDAFIFSSDPAVAGKYWAIRSGIFPSVGGMRREGTTCLIEQSGDRQEPRHHGDGL